MKRLIKTNSTTNEKIEQLISLYSNTTIKDDLYGAMSDFEEIKREFAQLGVNITSTPDSIETEIIKLEDGWLTVDIDPKRHSTWIAIDIYDEDDCPLEEPTDRLDEDVFDYDEDIDDDEEDIDQ